MILLWENRDNMDIYGTMINLWRYDLEKKQYYGNILWNNDILGFT